MKFGATLLPMKLLVKQKAKTVDNGKEKLKLLPFENEIPCEAIVKFQMLANWGGVG